MDNSALLSTNQIILTFIAFFCVFFFALILKKIYYRFVNKKRYFLFPKLDIKGITSVAMIISITVAVLLLLIGISGGFMGIIFRSYPAFRVTIEGILIKIGGLIFGPVIGIFIGALTDLLSIFLTAGMFHYGYFFAAICFGFFSGIINTLLTVSKFNMTKFMAFSMAFIGVCLASCCLFI
ncbi:hypothetical protein FACS189459_2580 [Bacilli bacterium]|nr:hypothetical protein FACS189459_2580 [Bacilli bacterium]